MYLAYSSWHGGKPGLHEFEVLKKVVFTDASVLRARCAGRPTCDCLYEDPVMDEKRSKFSP